MTDEIPGLIIFGILVFLALLLLWRGYRKTFNLQRYHRRLRNRRVDYDNR